MIEKKSTIQHYNKCADRFSKRYESADVSRLQNQLLSALKDCNSILELGCGSGRDAAFLKATSSAKNFKITDGSISMLKQAALLHPELSPNLQKLELPEDLMLESQKFEGVYSIAALMHLTQKGITRSLKLIADLLEPGGILFISVCTSRGKSKQDEQRYFQLKNREWWASQIENSGLSITSATDNADGLDRKSTVWLNLTAVKQEY